MPCRPTSVVEVARTKRRTTNRHPSRSVVLLFAQNDRAAAECSPDFDGWTVVLAWESL
jgi:hypothetical protein